MKTYAVLLKFVFIPVFYTYAAIDPDNIGQFLIGTGIYDITGQITETGFMGYGSATQLGHGILQRMRSRAFIVGDITCEENRVVCVVTDNCMNFQIIKTEVVERLNKIFKSDIYNDKNVLISATHTHSTPGGISGTVLADFTTYGFVKTNWEACVDGIVQSIVRAHKNLQKGRIKMNVGQIQNTNINRSPASYLRNIDKENYNSDTDHEMTVLRLESSDGNREIGMISFYPVHPVSLNNTNVLVSGDNKGYAAYLFEKFKNPEGTLPGQGQFVAAFAQSNAGDVSPNILGSKCIDTGLLCDFATSTCNGRSQPCIAFGPGKDMYESNEIIGRQQFEAAKDLYSNANVFISRNGSIRYRHMYIDMQNVYVNERFTSTGRNETTCQAALGYSFAAGTTDGPGYFDFKQSTNSSNPFWKIVSSFITSPDAKQTQCHAPKPILLDVGSMKPIPWVSFILPIQVFQIGNLYLVAVPGEVTTMSGRRLQSIIKQALEDSNSWTPDTHIVIVSMANGYSHYITTYEEYQQQRYEGGSTLFGPHTLAAYQQEYYDLTVKLIKNEPVSNGPTPFDMRGKTISLNLPPIWDDVPLLKKFGDVITNVKSAYRRGEIASCSWWGANPRNDLFTEKSFLYIDQFINGTWQPILTDDDYETRLIWKRKSIAYSVITVEWHIPKMHPVGNDAYRIRHHGIIHSIFGHKSYMALSDTFHINQ